jgi:hypothetical protein
MKTNPKITLPILNNAHWRLNIHPFTGAIAHFGHPADVYDMNWVSTSDENPTFLDSHGWGLGFLAMPGGNGPQRWQQVKNIKIENNTAVSQYLVGNIEVTVTRILNDNRFDESFEFRNLSENEQPIWGIGLYTPFNDNYPDAATCITRRCNAHLWCAGNTTYACCLRMGGTGPHLGMVLTDGYIGGYSIEGRGLMLGGSNLRGSMVLNANGLVLQPGQVHRIAWTSFWHQGWDDFFAQARTIPSFIEVHADHYTYVTGNPPVISLSDSTATIEDTVEKAGEQTLKINYGDGRETWVRLQAIDNIHNLVRNRVAFILNKQQVNDISSPYDGAFVCYDNETESQLPRGHRPDFSESRERLGMGVLLAQSLCHWDDDKIKSALTRYHNFVRTKLQLPDGTVLGQVDGDSHRLYNFPWVAQLHLELFHSTGENSYLDDCFETICAYYRQGGDHFYPIGLPIVDAVNTFRAAGRVAEADQLLNNFCQHGDNVVKNGLNLPRHEVNYEQTIVSPAVLISLECYLLTKDSKYLDCAKEMLPALEAFGGRQPDYRLNDIAIRHWDGYWFGKRETWGDVFPHHWSATTGWTFYLYWLATGDESYRRRGRDILLNNLSSFNADGSATCAYIYPDAVNGEPGRFADPLANDQDWILVFLMQAMRIDPELKSICLSGNED